MELQESRPPGVFCYHHTVHIRNKHTLIYVQINLSSYKILLCVGYDSYEYTIGYIYKEMSRAEYGGLSGLVQGFEV